MTINFKKKSYFLANNHLQFFFSEKRFFSVVPLDQQGSISFFFPFLLSQAQKGFFFPPMSLVQSQAQPVAPVYENVYSDDDDQVQTVSRVDIGLNLVGGVLSVVAMIGAVWAFQYTSTAPANLASGSLDITQSTTVWSSGGSNNQNTTVIIGNGNGVQSTGNGTRTGTMTGTTTGTGNSTGTKTGTGTGAGNGTTVTYTFPVRTDSMSLFLWDMAAVLGFLFIALLLFKRFGASR